MTKTTHDLNACTVIERNGCRLVTGCASIDLFASLCRGMPKNAVMDTHAARVLGVSFAIGTPEALRQLVSDPEVIAMARIRAEMAGKGLTITAKEWLALGRHGVSSKTIFQRLTGLTLTENECHPRDPADFGRCRLLLEAVPEFLPRLGELSGLSPVWAGLVSGWDDLCALMDSEMPSWREGRGAAPQTYKRMKELGC